VRLDTAGAAALLLGPRRIPAARGHVDTKSLVDKKVLEGAFIWAPLRMIGATGSPANPIVIF
jgi:hypothetical protein